MIILEKIADQDRQLVSILKKIPYQTGNYCMSILEKYQISVDN